MLLGQLGCWATSETTDVSSGLGILLVSSEVTLRKANAQSASIRFILSKKIRTYGYVYYASWWGDKTRSESTKRFGLGWAGPLRPALADKLFSAIQLAGGAFFGESAPGFYKPCAAGKSCRRRFHFVRNGHALIFTSLIAANCFCFCYTACRRCLFSLRNDHPWILQALCCWRILPQALF